MQPKVSKKLRMKLIDNINQLLGDDLKKAIQPGARLKIAASCFSIYAYEALKSELETVDSMDFIFTAPSFMPKEVADAVKKERREFHIPKAGTERNFYGTEFEVQCVKRCVEQFGVVGHGGLSSKKWRQTH